MTENPQLKSLPIYSHLEEICRALKSSESRFLILTAETGAGKSTAVPLALMEAFPKKILMLEPRKLAAVNVANRTATLLGEDVGQSCGYRVFLENKISSATRLEVMTEAILTRRLQKDPSLEDASVVVLDEFHERSINADLALAFLKEAMQLRDDLYVVIMSATIDAKKIAAFCASQNQGANKSAAPILEIPGRTFPVEYIYKPELAITSAVKFALTQIKSKTHGAKNSGRSILVFLPGIYEINKAFSELQALGLNAQINRLHSSISFEEQKKILSPAEPGTIRVILSSSIAETSLTIPDVACVIDCGLSRQSQMNNNVGASHLVTIPESEFSAAQRAGRAGRTQEGICVRLWSQNEPRQKNSIPEILRSDLSELLLECAEWGAKNPADLDWLDKPAPSSWATARELLEQLNCLDKNGDITNLGRAALRLGIGPRLACAAIYGGPKFILPYSQYKESAPFVQKKFLDNLQKRLDEVRSQFKDLPKDAASLPDPLLSGFPDRIAKRTSEQGVYQFPSGRVAALKDYSGGLSPEWIVAVEADAGTSQGAIYSYKELNSDKALKWLLDRSDKQIICDFENGKVIKTEFVQYGKIILSQKNLKAEADDLKKALCHSVQKKGFDSLPLNEKTKIFLTKLKFYEQHLSVEGGAQKTFDKDWLKDNADEWLAPFLTSNKITDEDVYKALYYFYDGSAIEEKVPSRITLSSGRSVKVFYEDKENVVPTIEIIIQQIFGCFETPKIMGQPVLLKLLSPARRPLQITSDLENFWQNTWPEICKEMKGRYPKHNWDYRVVQKD
ncbi:MAG: DEAD/DEAH box helicase [Treponema sp.]|nr:DEAD/DEAH box helicase [Treponema sp.]